MKCLLVVLAVFGSSFGQLNVRYNEYDSNGRYNPSNDGRYVADNSGAYRGDDGRYHPDNSGQYVHDGAGIYKDSIDKYKHQADQFGSGGSGSGKYSGGHSGNRVGGFGGSGDAVSVVTDASRFGSGSGSGSSIVGTGGAVVNVGIRPASEYRPPVAPRQGSAAGLYDNRNYGIIRQSGLVEEDGYHYLYETENGITGEEQGKLANTGTDAEAMQASGYYTYTGPDNVVYTVRYTANENGFVPEGDHIPTPPPIPAAIARALDYQRQAGTL